MTVTVTKRTVRLRWAQSSLEPGTPSGLPFAPCAVCGCDVPVLTPDEACALLQGTAEDLFALISSGRVHAIHTVSGNDLICRDSLFLGSRQ